MADFFSEKQGKGSVKIGLVGFGQSGQGVFTYLKSRGIAPASVRSFDPLPPSALALLPQTVKLFTGKGYLDGIAEDILFISPAVRRDTPALQAAKRKGTRLCSDVELFFEYVRGAVFAVTGSDGKTTTTTLTHRLLTEGGAFSDVAVGGNIGIPLSPLLADDAASRAYAVELSSFQLMDVSPRSRRALVTNLTPNHLNWHLSFDEYRRAKAHLYENCEEPVLNADSPACRAMLDGKVPFAAFSAEVSGFELSRLGAEVVYTYQNENINRNGKPFMRGRDIPLKGLFNVKNVMAALCLTDGFISPDTARKTIAAFCPVPHRMQTVRTLGGVAYVDSSIDTTPARTAVTLNAQEKPVIVLLGGRGKNIPYDALIAPLVAHAKAVLLFGENAGEISETLAHSALFLRCGIPVLRTASQESALSIAHALALPGDTVLLSPASTSFDAFHNYEERGNAFAALVRALPDI